MGLQGPFGHGLQFRKLLFQRLPWNVLQIGEHRIPDFHFEALVPVRIGDHTDPDHLPAKSQPVGSHGSREKANCGQQQTFDGFYHKEHRPDKNITESLDGFSSIYTGFARKISE